MTPTPRLVVPERRDELPVTLGCSLGWRLEAGAHAIAGGSPLPAALADGSIEISFRSATIRVRGTGDARTLTTVLDCLAQRA